MEKLLQEYIEEHRSVGAAVALVEKGELHIYTQGKKSVTSDEPISEETIFEIGSLTKLFTSLALVDMFSQGMVSLEDPIEYGWGNLLVPPVRGVKITLQHLATHTSGIPRLPSNFHPKNPADPFADYTEEMLYHFLNRHAFIRVPGKTLEYSDLGMGLLGHILSLRANRSYEQLILDTIQDSMKMRSTFIDLPKEKEKDLATGHWERKEVPQWNFAALAGTGALRSSIKDMGSFLMHSMGVIASHTANLLKECQKKRYETEQLKVGFGWILLQVNNAELLTQNGGTGGFRSYIGINPVTEKGVVILSNSREHWPDELGRVLLDPDFKRPKVNAELASDLDYLNKFSGHYEVSFPNGQPKQQLEISAADRHLHTLFTGGAVGMLYPERFGLFGVKGFSDGRVQFSFDKGGSVSRAQAFFKGDTLLWEAIPKMR